MDRSKEEILKEVESALTQFVVQEVDESVQADMKQMISRFFWEELSRYSMEELAAKLNSPETVIRMFREYLDRTTGCRHC